MFGKFVCDRVNAAAVGFKWVSFLVYFGESVNAWRGLTWVRAVIETLSFLTADSVAV